MVYTFNLEYNDHTNNPKDKSKNKEHRNVLVKQEYIEYHLKCPHIAELKQKFMLEGVFHGIGKVHAVSNAMLTRTMKLRHSVTFLFTTNKHE